MPKTAERPAAVKPSVKPAIKGTYGTMYYVKDMKKSVAWFTSKLGLKPAFESPDWTEFSLSGQSLCLHALGKDTKDVFVNGCLILHVDGIRALVQDLKSKGARVKGDVHEVHPGAYSAMLADPDGNALSLYEGPKGC